MLKTVITIIYIIVCIAAVVVVLMQEGKDGGLSALSGSSDTYWSKNKNRSKEGALVMITRVVFVLFIALSVLLNTKLLG